MAFRIAIGAMLFALAIGALAAVLFVIPAGFLPTSEPAEGPTWQTNFTSFSAHVSDAFGREADLAELYEKKEITWRLRFIGFPTEWRGPGGEQITLRFDTGHGPSRARFWFMGRLANGYRDWEIVKPGTWITVRGRIETAFVVPKWGGADPYPYFEIVDVESPR